MRRKVRARRRALSGPQVAAAARAVSQCLTESRVFQQADTIAAYHAVRGELDLSPVVAAAREAGKTVCLPRVEGQQMAFVAVDADCTMQSGSFGIPEPVGGHQVNNPDLDLVLVPVVAFDASGTRVGMGGGYYDRTFADPGVRPLMVGVAYDWQEQAELVRRSWDVAIRAVVTESGLRWFDS